MSSHSGTIGRKRDYYFNGEQMRRQRSAEWHSRHGYSSSEDEYQNNTQNSMGSFDTQLLASLLIQSQQLATDIDRSYRSDCDNEEVTESLLTEYPHSYQTTNIDSPNLAAKSSRNPFSLKYELHSATEPDRVSFTGSVSDRFDRLQTTDKNSSNGTTSSSYLPNNISLNPNNTVRSSRSKNGRLNRVSGMTSSSSATSSNSNAAVRDRERERERQKLHHQQQQQQLEQEILQQKQKKNKELKEFNSSSNHDNIYDPEDKTIFEPPPEPAPPEIPPRTQSLLLSMRKRSDYQLKYEENGDQKHEEFIPASQQKEYTKSAENSRQQSEPQPKSITSNEQSNNQG